MDNFAYYLRSCGGTDEYAAEPLVRRWSATYDLVVRLLPDVALQADGVRSTNDAFRDEVEAILDDVLPGLVPADRLVTRPGLGDHEPVRLVRGAAAARDGHRGHGRRTRPLALTRAARPDRQRRATRPRPGPPAPRRRARAPSRRRSSGSIVTVSPALPVLARPRRTSRSSGRRRPSAARAASARTAPPRRGATARRPGRRRRVRRPRPRARPGPSRRRPPGRARRARSAPAMGRARPSGRAAGSAPRGSGDASSSSRTQPASPRSHHSRWAGDSETSGREASRRNGPRSAAIRWAAARRRVSRLVEVHVHREGRVGDRVVPALEQALRERPQRLDRRCRPKPPARDGVGQDEGPQLLGDHGADRRVAEVAEADDARGRSRGARPCGTRSPGSRRRATRSCPARCRRGRRGRSRSP